MRRRFVWFAGLVLTCGVSTAAAGTPPAPHGTVTISGTTSQLALAATPSLQTALYAIPGVIAATDHVPGTRTWTPPVVVANILDSPYGMRLAADRSGAATAVWWGRDEFAPGLRPFSATRDAAGAWGAPVRLATDGITPGIPAPPLDVARLPGERALAVFATPAGGLVAHVAGADGAWDAGTPLADAGVDAVAVTETPTGAVVVWEQLDGVAMATLTGAAWTGPVGVPGAPTGLEWVDVARIADGRLVVAWTFSNSGGASVRRLDGTWRSSGFAFRASSMSSPAAGTVAIAGDAIGSVPWQRVAVLTGADTWDVTVPPVTGGTFPAGAGGVAVAQDGSVVRAGPNESGVWSWSRLARGARRWSPPVVVSDAPRRRDTGGGVVVAGGGTGRALATTVWTSLLIRPDAAGDQGILQYAEVDPEAPPPFPVTLMRLGRPADAASRLAAGGVTRLTPVFERYSGSVPVRVQQLRGGRWVAVGAARAVREVDLEVRFTGPGTAVRLRYGPRFRMATNVLPLRVVAPATPRVIAGWEPQRIVASGPDLWVLSRPRGNGAWQLRLLDARTGRVRGGPVDVPGIVELMPTGPRALLSTYDDATGETRFRVLDPLRPGLLGPRATLTAGSCTETTCTPTRITAGGRSWSPTESSNGLGPVAAPGGRVWGTVAGTFFPVDPAHAVHLIEVTGAGERIDRGELGAVRDALAPFVSDMVTTPHGLWLLFQNRLSWFGAAGPGVEKGVYAAVAHDGRCLWALNEPRSPGTRTRGRRPGGRPGERPECGHRPGRPRTVRGGGRHRLGHPRRRHPRTRAASLVPTVIRRTGGRGPVRGRGPLPAR